MDSNSTRPRYIDHALMAAGVDPLDEDAFLDTFVRRWGALDLDALTRVFHEGDADERLFAIWGLGYKPTSQAHALLLGALDSATTRERAAVAMCLGNAGEKRSVPVLSALLTDHLPGRLADFLTEGFTEYDDTRGDVPAILAKLGDRRATPYLVQAMKYVTDLVAQSTLFPGVEALPLHQLPVPRRDFGPDSKRRLQDALAWQSHRYIVTTSNVTHHEGNTGQIVASGEHNAQFEWLLLYLDDIVYALGGLGAFGALTGISAPDLYLRVWMVHLIMGSMWRNFAASVLKAVAWGKTSEQILVDALGPPLQEYFGLFEDEQAQSVTLYTMIKLSRTALMCELAERDERR